MPPVSLVLCGRAQVQVGADPAVAAQLSAKSLGLMAFLALEPGPHSRDELKALLWGEVPDDKASASLRQALTQLRTVLDGHLRIDRASVELDPAVPCDVRRFLDQVGRNPVAALAVDIPRFLEGLTLNRSPAFEEWLDVTRVSLLSRYCRALAECGRAAAARRDSQGAVEWAERWLAADPTSEEAAHLLIESRYLAGDEAGALVAYDQFKSRLEAREGRSPGITVRELARRIQSGRPRIVPVDRSEPAPERKARFTASLTGRAGEWEQLVRAWDATRAGQGRTVVIEGESGIGKSRLAEDYGRWIVSHGGTVLRSQAFEEGLGVPFGPMLEVLRAVLEVPGVAGTDPAWLAEVARVLPEIRQRFPALSAPTSAPGTLLLFEAVSELLKAAADDRPVAVLIDDLQWCDPDSCAMLHYVVRRLEASPVLWCTTLTPGDLDRDAPAARLARALRASPANLRIQLVPLDADQVWTLLRELGRLNTASAGRRLASRIHEMTAGNPFYVIELLKMLFAKGWLTLHPETGEWIVPTCPEGEPDIETIPSVHEAIVQRVARLPDDLHAVLMALAVSGSGCPTTVLSPVHGISRLRAAAIGDALVDRHLAVEEHGRYRCAHPVIARVVRSEMTGARRREIHRAIALALRELTSTSGETVDPGEIAHHAEQGGEPALAYEQALEASRSSREKSAFEEALAWLDLAAACAETPEQTATVDRATAELLAAAKWDKPPAPARSSGPSPTLTRSDFDLPVLRDPG